MNPQDELDVLTGIFPGGESLIESAEHIPSALAPGPYQQMLVHGEHMTVAMEDYHQSQVDVKILDSRSDGDVYSRKILLLKTGTENVVQFGIVRFHFGYVTPQVREEILEGKTPLGRVLINHNVLRHIDLAAVLRVTPGKELRGYFQMPPGEVTYGRLATIFCNHQPAVDLLEISAPLTTTETVP